jgi:flagellar protein FliO/FliZ
MTGLGLQGLLAVLLVLGLVGALAWLARRGTFASLQKRGAVTVETAVPLGDRRSLVIVAVEGRRLLLGLTAAQITMVTELKPVPAQRAPASSAHPDAFQEFEQEVASRL